MVVAWYTWLNEYLTFDNLKENRIVLYSFVEDHYFSSVILFVAAVVTTGFFVPAAIPMILVGGFLFGIFWGTIYVNLGFTVGATLAFLFSRYVIGNWIQHRYESQLRSFNDEISRHGRNYLITLRMIPLFPFFSVNYFAGVTKMPLARYVWSTALGMLPISVAYSFAGREIGRIESPNDIMSARFLIVVLLLALFALLPVLHHYLLRLRDKR
jgi:uncharacterized membrane protein YdjX (TVP38/TMEM64 family)